MLKYRKVVFWVNRNNQTYYIKKYRSMFHNFKVGYINQYNHEILCILNTSELEFSKEPIKTRLIKSIINFLEHRL